MPKSQNIQAIETGLSDFQQMSNCIESSLHQTENMYVTKHITSNFLQAIFHRF